MIFALLVLLVLLNPVVGIVAVTVAFALVGAAEAGLARAAGRRRT